MPGVITMVSVRPHPVSAPKTTSIAIFIHTGKVVHAVLAYDSRVSGNFPAAAISPVQNNDQMEPLYGSPSYFAFFPLCGAADTQSHGYSKFASRDKNSEHSVI